MLAKVSRIQNSIEDPLVYLFPSESGERDCLLPQILGSSPFKVLKKFPDDHLLPAVLHSLISRHLLFLPLRTVEKDFADWGFLILLLDLRFLNAWDVYFRSTLLVLE